MKLSIPPALLSFALLLFIVLEMIGTHLSIEKPLWRDELNTQSYTLQESYPDLMLGRDAMEGNRAPLFYLLQKIFCDIFNFKTPKPWLSGQWDFLDSHADIFLRILPVFWMSCFLVLIFVYFAWRFNWLIAAIGLFTALSYPIIWLYWAEARPYGLWLLLTALQMILFLEILRDEENNKKWVGLGVIHLLLSANCILSIFQIIAVSLMLIFKIHEWKKYSLILILALLIIFIYWPRGSGFDAVFITTIPQLFFSTLPINHIVVLLLYFVLLRLFQLLDNNARQKFFTDDQTLKALPFFLTVVLMMASVFIFLAYLFAHSTGHGQFVIQRHILFIVPVAIIASTYLLGIITQSIQSWPMKSLLLIIILLLLSIHLPEASQKILFLMTHNPYA